MADATEVFFTAWSEPDAEERLRTLRSSVHADGTYADPMTPEPLVGPEAIGQYLGAFVENAPGATAAVIDSQDRHGMTRATVAFSMADGQRQYGQYFVELAADGTIERMVGFVGVPSTDASN